MGLALRALAAFCIGAFALMGVQKMWFSTVTGYVTSADLRTSLPTMRPVVSTMDIKPGSLIEAMHPKIDPNIGKAAAGAYINNQVNQALRASQNIPRPPSMPSIPGFRR